MRGRFLWLVALAASAVRGEVIEVSEGTNLSFALHPDKEYIAVDLLGGLWRLPVTGGAAAPLLPTGSGVAQPRFDPAGERIVFQRWETGQWDIWLLTLASGEALPLTRTDFDEREPEFRNGGQEVVFAANRSGNYQLWALEVATGAVRQLTDEPGDARFPTAGPADELAYINVTTSRSEIRLYEGGLTGRTLHTNSRRLDAPSFRPGGGVLILNERDEGASSSLRLLIAGDEPIWRPMTEDEDVFVGRPAWLSPEEYVYAADGALWRRGIGSLERTRILMFAGVDVETLAAESVAVPRPSDDAHPIAGINDRVRHSASGRSAFTALGDLWLLDERGLARLTDDAFTDVQPQFSADGEWLIFVSDRDGDFDLWQIRIDNGQLLQLSNDAGAVFEARLSGDGSRVGFLESTSAGRWDGARLKLLNPERPFAATTLDADLFAASDLHWQGSFLRLSASDGPADETYLHVYETEVGDSPSARTLLPNDDDDSRLPEDDRLSWRRALPAEPYVIQAGRMFDGIGNQYRYHLDIHIDGHRITDIVGRDILPLPERVIDARDSTVLPGLIDVHAHLGTAGAALGRQWLRYGVTTVRVVGDDWRRAVERAETWASGHQPGPRLIVGSIADDIALPDGSPIIVSSGRGIFGGLAHALSDQRARDGRPSPLPPLSGGPDTGHTQWFALSSLGRSYGDVFARMEASGAYLATGLGALESVLADQQARGLAGAYARVMRRTGRVAIGSDAPAVPYGQGFHGELLRLAEQGIPNDQILRLATAGGAIALGLTLETGTLEPGRLADLVIVGGNPLNELEDLSQTEIVVVGGVLHTIESLNP